MDTSKTITMNICMTVTIPQALALQAMFECWSKYGHWGCSRDVGFFADGDGNFRPECEVSFSEPVPELTDELRELAIRTEHSGDRIYDYDSIARKLRDT